MSKNHLKKLAAPSTWQIKRKGMKFVARPKPGPHSLRLGRSLNFIFKELLKYGKTTKDIKNILNNKNVLVDGIRRKDHKFITGIFDTIEIADKKEYFRLILDKKGRINAIQIDKNEAGIKPCKIIGKRKIKGKTQLNLYDGKNILVDKDSYKVGDSLLITVPKQEIKAHIKFDKKKMICLIGGKHIGDTGIIEDIKGKNIFYKSILGEVIETLKRYAFVIGEEKPIIKLPE